MQNLLLFHIQVKHALKMQRTNQGSRQYCKKLAGGAKDGKVLIIIIIMSRHASSCIRPWETHIHGGKVTCGTELALVR